jgi:3-methyladenine DNA glycosylase AlkD
MIQQAIAELRHELERAANHDKAPQMAAYMKDRFPFLGVQATKRNEITREWTPSIKELDFWETIEALWEEEEREFQYVAVELLKKRKVNSFHPDDDARIRRLIVSKSWWDTVDLIASSTLGNYLKRFPERTEAVITDYTESENIWLMRSTLIFQLKYGKSCDFELLKKQILKFRRINEFFIQKAIGWALRQHSKIDPESVRNFLKTIDLSTVAKREAYKYI